MEESCEVMRFLLSRNKKRSNFDEISLVADFVAFFTSSRYWLGDRVLKNIEISVYVDMLS